MSERPSVQALSDIAAERERQKTVKGWTETHDDDHTDGSLAQAAACYALPVSRRQLMIINGTGRISAMWPSSWSPAWWKPSDRRRDLVKAGALIVAEIERLDRAAAKSLNAQDDSLIRSGLTARRGRFRSSRLLTSQSKCMKPPQLSAPEQEAIDEIIELFPTQWAQAVEKISLIGWFVAQAMLRNNGHFDGNRIRVALVERARAPEAVARSALLNHIQCGSGSEAIGVEHDRFQQPSRAPKPGSIPT